jgi:ubiquinone/menaquinone biosynthesis C-methylase UbiE
VKPASLDVLRCPACRDALDLADDDGALRCPSGHAFAVVDGIASVVHPESLHPSDAEFQEKYDRSAAQYDEGSDWLFNAFRVDEAGVRESLVDLLEVGPGARVLETGSGTGRDSRVILERIRPEGALYAVDISLGMLKLARTKLDSYWSESEYIHANASYLPFADDAFDAAFHFGGINMFGDISRAFAEMNRVVRVGGKIVIGDEGIAPWLKTQRYGRVLVNANPLYANSPPLDALPGTATEVRLQWILGAAFYVLDFRVGAEEPFVDLDLPIPGKGDTLRSRYADPRR